MNFSPKRRYNNQEYTINVSIISNDITTSLYFKQKDPDSTNTITPTEELQYIRYY